MSALSGGTGGGGGGYTPDQSWRQNAGLGGIPAPWALQTGGNDPAQNNTAAASATPGAPSWLQAQLGQFLSQPFNADPSGFGRWNWANQGHSTPGSVTPTVPQGGTTPPSPPPDFGPQPGSPPPAPPPTNGPPPGTPAPTGDNFGPSVGNNPTPAAGSAPWMNFRYSNPTTPTQQNFNALAAQDPNAAFSYAFSGRPGNSGAANELTRALTAGGFNGTGVLDAYSSGGVAPTSGIGQSIGLPDNFNAPRSYLDPSGKSFIVNGKSYSLANPEAARNPWSGQLLSAPQGLGGWGQANRANPISPLGSAGQNNGPGSAAWWAAVNANSGK